MKSPYRVNFTGNVYWKRESFTVTLCIVIHYKIFWLCLVNTWWFQSFYYIFNDKLLLHLLHVHSYVIQIHWKDTELWNSPIQCNGHYPTKSDHSPDQNGHWKMLLRFCNISQISIELSSQLCYDICTDRGKDIHMIVYIKILEKKYKKGK